MSQNLCGKWYVYRYNLEVSTVLKAPETTLEISGQTPDGCLARFDLSGWTEPVEVAMIAEDNHWRSQEEGSFGFLDVRWVRVEHGYEEPIVLLGQVINQDEGSFPLSRDFFVAVRSRRTHQVPDRMVHHFGGSYLMPFSRKDPSTTWPDDDHPGIDLDLCNDKPVIRINGTTYEIEFQTRYQGGLRIEGKNPDAAEEVNDRVVLWILPGAEPGQPGYLLATGYHEYKKQSDSGADPGCHRGLQLC